MKNSMKNCTLVLVVMGLLLLAATPVNARTKVETEGIYVDTPTQSEVIQFIKNNPILLKTNNKVTYESVPSIKNPYRAGKTSVNHLVDGLNAVNIVRYIAGLPANLELDEDYTTDAQAAAVVNSANNVLDHTPDRPENMSDELYGTGYAGASNSNLGMGYPLLSNSVILGFMEDGDPKNISVLGHRRWVMNPPIKKTGFGFAPNNFSAMYIMDNSNSVENNKYSVLAWPAQAMPTEYFGKEFPFSVSLNEDFDNLVRENIQVRMTRQGDGKVFLFNQSTSNGLNSQIYFDVDNQNTGQPHCIIWRPDISIYKNGDVFSVEIFGVKKNGNSYPISYNVTFFGLESSTNSNTTSNIPQLSKVGFSLSKINPKTDTMKVNFTTNTECQVYCKVYDNKKNKVATISNGGKVKNAGNWSVSWKGKDANGKAIAAGAYRIETYLSKGNKTSKAISKYIEVLPTDFPLLTNLKLSATSFKPGTDLLNIYFSTDRDCKLYCFVYDSNNNKVASVTNGSAIKNAGGWVLKWKGIDSSGYYFGPGKYRVDIYLGNGIYTGNVFSQYVEIDESVKE